MFPRDHAGGLVKRAATWPAAKGVNQLGRIGPATEGLNQKDRNRDCC